MGGVVLRPAPILMAAALALSACQGKEAPKPPPARPAPKAAAPAPRPAPADGPLDPASPAAAAKVVETYYALVDDGRFAEAWTLWSDGGKASGGDAEALARQFADYESYDVSVGAADQIEGAAGSSYIQLPIHVEAARRNGAEEHANGSVTLRRVNNVDGATPEQLQWRIYKIDLQDSE